MKLPGLIAAAALVAATPFQVMDGVDHSHSPGDDLRRPETLGAESSEPPETPVTPGDRAPDFSFESHEHQWQHLHDLLSQGNVLLVFGATEVQLGSLQQERAALLARGVLPVAILDRRDGAVWSMLRRLGIEYSLLADPRCVIAEQFNVLQPATHRPMPSWFVIDRTGNVRALKRDGLPASGFVALSCGALALPASDAPVPTSAR